MDERTIEIFEELEKLSKPLLDFLGEYFNMNCSIVIKHDNIRVISDELSIPVAQEQINSLTHNEEIYL